MQLNKSFSLEQIIDRQPLIVAPKTLLTEVIRQMREWANNYYLTESNDASDPDSLTRINNSCALVVEDTQLQGIFTERDLVKLIATERDLAEIVVGQVMSRELITLTASDMEDLFIALNLMRQHYIRHLPIVDESDRLLGLITEKNLRQNLQPLDLMKWRRVEEVMSDRVIHAPPTISVRQAAKLMAENQVSYVAIVESDREESELLIPVGIVTERDLVQFQSLNLDFSQPVQRFMCTPLFLVNPNDSLWSIHEQMQQHRLRRLLVAGSRGELRGIITQTNLLQVFDPTEMCGVVDVLQRQIYQLKNERAKYLDDRARELEKQVNERTAELRQAHQQLFFHINNTPLAVVEWDSNFCVKHWSKRAEQIFGWSKSEVMGKHWRDWQFVLEADLEDVIGITSRLFDSTEPRNISHNRNYTKKGAIVTCEWYNSVLLDEAGNLISILSLVQDVSAREIALCARAEAETALRESEQLFRNMANNAPMMVWVTDGTGYCTYVSQSWYEFTGQTKETGLEFGWLEAVHPDDRDRTQTIFLRATQRQEAFRLDYRLHHHDGEYRWVIDAAKPWIGNDGQFKGYIGSVIDISDRKRREEILQDIASGVSVETGVNFLPSLCEYLCKTLKVDYAFVGELIQPEADKIQTLAIYAGSQIIDNFTYPMAGTPCEEVIGQGLCIYPEAIQELFPHDLMLQEMAAESYAGIPIFKSNGSAWGLIAVLDSKPFDDVTPIEEVLKIFATRVTSELERQQAENKIREQAALLDIATDAIMVRGLDDRILFWNRGAEKLYGWTKAEALNRNANELLYRESSTELSIIQQIVTQQQGEWQGELNQVTKADKDIVVQSRWTLVRDEAGNPSSYLVVKSDITEQKQLEAQFLRTQRLESLGTLAGGIAHDLKNILAPLLGFSRLLPLKLPDLDEQTKSFFQIMENNAQRGTALVQQILTFSQGTEGEKGIVQIRHLIEEIGQIIKETFPKTIELEINAPKNLWTVNADPNQLHQVLMNLAVNARDAMPEGGRLKIAAENFPIDANFARLYLDAHEGSYLLITVSDTGVGIPPEIIDRIFEPFFTTKEIGHGTGLGLSTVIGIVKNHGGFIDVISERQRGTQFKVFLPASETAAIAIETTAELPQGNGELILVVDDEPAILEVTKATLETFNYRVLTAGDGVDAIAIYTQNQAEIGVVLMDLMMPEISGLTAMRTLKKINPSVKLIANSGLAEKDKITAAEKIGIKAFLAKPYSVEKLLQQLKDVIAAN
ncbi:MAG: PAS domain S-box protein [Pleurocapsa sp. MO_226.B13]|nr:PAS domain S-box protein [Pleurocapsa sp. MO_226.B13]